MKVVLLLAVASVALGVEVCYPPCGCFNDDPPFDTRPLPEGWEEAPIIWLLYTQSNRNNPQEVRLPNVTPPSFFDPSKETHFLIHGWTGSPNSMAQVRDAILDNYDHNVFMVDWSVGGGRSFYPQSASTIQVTGACSAYVASQLTNLDTVSCAGHSLGGQTCGYMGKRAKNPPISGTPRLKRATGLDPAGPLFDSDDYRVRIDEDDALFVDNIHTNAQALGLGKSVAQVDFYPNKGGRQPMCNNGDCDHGICRDFYAASISAQGNCQFSAYPCDSEADADGGNCETCSGGDCQRMGYFANTMPGRGQYFLRTVAGYPYCED